MNLISDISGQGSAKKLLSWFNQKGKYPRHFLHSTWAAFHKIVSSSNLGFKIKVVIDFSFLLQFHFPQCGILQDEGICRPSRSECSSRLPWAFGPRGLLGRGAFLLLAWFYCCGFIRLINLWVSWWQVKIAHLFHTKSWKNPSRYQKRTLLLCEDQCSHESLSILLFNV